MPGSPSRSQCCRVVFRGHSEVLAAAFPEFATEVDGGNTALIGTIVDQAHLLGLMGRADSLGFVVLSVNPIGTRESPGTELPGQPGAQSAPSSTSDRSAKR